MYWIWEHNFRIQQPRNLKLFSIKHFWQQTDFLFFTDGLWDHASHRDSISSYRSETPAPALPYGVFQHIHSKATDTYSGQPVTMWQCLSACEWAACDLITTWKSSRAQKCKPQQNMKNEKIRMSCGCLCLRSYIILKYQCPEPVWTLLSFLSYKIMTYNKLWSCLDISVWLLSNFNTGPRGEFKIVQSSKVHKDKEALNVSSSNYKQNEILILVTKCLKLP